MRGATYNVAVHNRVDDGHQAVEHWRLKHLDSYRYKLHLQRLGYRDPIVNARGGIDEDDGSALIGWLGQPHPTMPGYILSWEGFPVRVGSHVYIREDWPLVASEDFPGWVLTYLPQVRLQQLGQPGGFAPLDDGYFNRLRMVRDEEERRLRDAMRNVPTPWLKAGLNALPQVATAPILLLLSGASQDTASFTTALRQTRLLPYRPGQEEQRGEIAETVIGVYGGMLGPWTSGAARVLAAATFRELGGALATLRGAAASERTGLGWLNGLRVETAGLGSNFGNIRISSGTSTKEALASTHAAPSSLPTAEIRSLQRGIRSLEKRRTEHIEKLQAYRENPDAYDNLGYLKESDNEQIRQKIISTRIRHLEKEIQDFEKQILRYKQKIGE